MLTLATVMMLGAAPPSIVDAYKLLVKEKKVDPVLREEGGHWKYVAAVDDLTPDKGEPVVDTRNGYARFGFQQGPCSTSVELALYVAGARRFVLVSTDADCMEGHNASVAAWELQGEKLTDVTEALELKKIAWTDFLDQKAPREEAETVAPAVALSYTLPRSGTTVQVKLVVMHEPPTGVDQSFGPRAEALAKKFQRFKVIELAWSEKDAKFKKRVP
ncbi:MAG: hypothetical protein QM723_15360 [Myxococcaceae bacterium]